jgi:hypothetical protein
MVGETGSDPALAVNSETLFGLIKDSSFSSTPEPE